MTDELVPSQEGFINVTGGRVWYQIIGGGKGIPLVALHGGPGGTHYVLQPLEALADERPVILYDQLGSGKSERPTDPGLWRIGRFVEELARVRDALELDTIHLFGISWGTILATEYLLTRPRGVASVILAGPCMSIPRYLQDAAAYKRQLPEEVQATLARHEAAGTTDSAEYQAASLEYDKLHLCRIWPYPEPVRQSRAAFGDLVYHTMWGPCESFATGLLQDYDSTSRLGEITLPTLFTCGRYDTCTPEATAWYSQLVPGSTMEIFEQSSHMPHIEETQAYLQTVRKFLQPVDSQVLAPA